MSDSGAAVLQTIREIAARLAGRPVESIASNERIFGGGLDLDSMLVVTLLDEIEQRFGVSVPDADLDLASLRGVDTLSRMVSSLRAQQER